jgi:chromate reductase
MTLSDSSEIRTPASGSPIEVVAVAGSLRRKSHNRALLEAAAQLAPTTVTVSVFEGLETIPVFNADIEVEDGIPDGVSRLRQALAGADGLLIATPEYNQSVPGVVKNMIDWLSRGGPGRGLAGYPIAVTGASTGPWGTRIAQTSLRQMLLSSQALVMADPTLFVPRVESLVDADGNLVDPVTRERLREIVTSFADWIRLVSAGEKRSAAG